MLRNYWRIAKPRKGFALSELLISILILSTLSVILVGVIPSAMFGMKKAENKARASILARETLEYIKRCGFRNIKTDMDISPVIDYQHKADERSWYSTDFTIKVTVGNAFTQEGKIMDQTKTKDVQVTVTWKEKNKICDFTARTIFYKE